MNGQEMLDRVRGQEGSQVFVSYVPGREPTARAVREAGRSSRQGISRRHFVGTLHRVWRTKRGQPVITVLCDNRDDERTGSQQGYRTFNPELGSLLVLEVLS